MFFIRANKNIHLIYTNFNLDTKIDLTYQTNKYVMYCAPIYNKYTKINSF